MSTKLLTAIALLALSTSAVALEDVVVELTSDVTDTSEYGRRTPSGDPRTGSVRYEIELDAAYKVFITASIYDIDFPGDYLNPGELEISISGFTPDTTGDMSSAPNQYQPFEIEGILLPGVQTIDVTNKNPNWTWGIKDVRVQLVGQVTDLNPLIPFIPEPPIQLTPTAATVKVENYCDTRFSDDSYLRYSSQLPLSILEYADQIQNTTFGNPTNSDRERFLDYVHYVERVTDRSYLRQSIGTNAVNMGSLSALMQIPGEFSEFGETEHVWCSASCPSGYTQTAIQCDTTFLTTESFSSSNIREGFDSVNACGIGTDVRGAFSSSDQLTISTSLTCTRDVEIFKYRDVQGTPDWPIKN